MTLRQLRHASFEEILHLSTGPCRDTNNVGISVSMCVGASAETGHQARMYALNSRGSTSPPDTGSIATTASTERRSDCSQTVQLHENENCGEHAWMSSNLTRISDQRQQ